MNQTSEQQDRSWPFHAVLKALGIVYGVDWDDLPMPLYDALDPDALIVLFESSTDEISVSFDYDGRDVEIRSDKTVAVDGTVVEPGGGD
ncbi:HalOD1 output domain-containing protein [Haladaptatus sp. DFWS20]|uniref:HalOD1 output domain-containing protein n=1 Tax=Haladaptatus sp. DFWS20 TaxID=3403467 RepID=UPI003EB7F909